MPWLQKRRAAAAAILALAGIAVATAGTPVIPNWAIDASGNIYKADDFTDQHLFHVDGPTYGLLLQAPTIDDGGCASGSAQSISALNGSAAFQITLGGADCGSTITLVLPEAPTSWVCDAHNVTTPASQVMDMTGVPSKTDVVLTNYVRTTGVAGNFTGAEKIAVKCVPY